MGGASLRDSRDSGLGLSLTGARTRARARERGGAEGGRGRGRGGARRGSDCCRKRPGGWGGAPGDWAAQDPSRSMHGRPARKIRLASSNPDGPSSARAHAGRSLTPTPRDAGGRPGGDAGGGAACLDDLFDLADDVTAAQALGGEDPADKQDPLYRWGGGRGRQGVCRRAHAAPTVPRALRRTAAATARPPAPRRACSAAPAAPESRVGDPVEQACPVARPRALDRPPAASGWPIWWLGRWRPWRRRTHALWAPACSRSPACTTASGRRCARC